MNRETLPAMQTLPKFFHHLRGGKPLGVGGRLRLGDGQFFEEIHPDPEALVVFPAFRE